MTATDLLTPLLGGGIRRVNFFNGRLLTAEDLGAERAAERAKRAQLGRLLEPGVARGLMVTAVPGAASGTAAVLVEPGLAVDALGQVVALPAAAEVRLVRGTASAAPDAGLFEVCVPPAATALPSGVGAYVLTIAGASGFEGRAPAAGLAASALPGGACGSRWAVEGVRFRMVPLPIDGIAAPAGTAVEFAARADAEGRALLRSAVAEACLGTAALGEALADRPAASGAPAGEVGALAELAASGALERCEVPLALLVWGGNGLGPPDPWAVRRPLAVAEADALHGLATGRTARRLGLAATLRFQAAMAEEPAAGPARARLVALPPAGLLPPFADWGQFLGHNGPAAAKPADPAVLGAALREALDLPGAMLRPADPATGRVTGAEPYEVLDGGPECGFLFRRLSGPRLRVILRDPPAGLVVEARPAIGGPAARAALAPNVAGVSWGSDGERGFVADGAAPGEHAAVALAAGGGGQTTSSVVALRAGRTTDVLLDAPAAAPDAAPAPTAGGPPRCVTVTDLQRLGRSNLQLCLVREQPQAVKEALRFHLLPGKGRAGEFNMATAPTPPPWAGMPAVSPLPAAIASWLAGWSEHLRADFPDGRSLGTPALHVDADWIPSRIGVPVREGPPAWARFGAVAYPVQISATELLTRVQVPIRDAGIAGLDVELIRRLEAIGIETVDELAASWSERLRGPKPEGGLDPAPDLIADAAGRAAAINSGREYLVGVTPEVRNELTRLGLADDVSLANADPAALGQAIGDAGLAGRLVVQARRAVPESAWSIGALGLAPAAGAGLAAAGLDSQGALVRAAAVPEKRQAAIAALAPTAAAPIAAAQLDTLVLGAVGNLTRASVEHSPVAPLESLQGVDRSIAGRLAAGGIATVEELVGANPATVAAAADIAENEAAALISRAAEAGAAGRDVGRLASVEPDAATALRGLGLGTLGALAKADVATVARALGGDTARAGALLGGARLALRIR